MKWMSRVGCGFLFLTVGCSHLSASKNLVTPDYLLSAESKQVTFLGDNEHPRFSDNGARIIYTSRARTTHKGSQVYELDLIQNKERRVTFSDGDAFDASYLSDDEILYASTTDEIKESPLQNKNHSKEFPPSELYMSDVYGNDILRISQQPGFDGEPFFVKHEVKPFIIFASRRGDLLGIYRLDLKNLPVSLISAEKDKEKHFATISPDQKQLAWAERDLKTQEQSLVLYQIKGKTTQVLKKNEGLYRDLFFAPRPPLRLFYSILRPGEKYYQIEVYDIANHCTQVVFKGSDSLMDPTISNESNERIAFTRLIEDKKQIYIGRLPSDLGSCLEAPAQATLNK